MLNGELIKLLQEFPDDLEIEVFDYMEGVSAGTVETVWVNKRGQLVLHCNWKDNIEE